MNKRLAMGLFLLAAAATGLAEPRRTPAISVTMGGGAVPNPIVINAPAGGPNPGPTTITLQNTGSPGMNWTAAVGAGAPWLDVNPKGGKLNPGASIDLSITVNVLSPTVLAVGTYNGTFTITAAGATGSPKDINIRLNVSSTAVITLSPSSLSLAAPVNTGTSGNVTLQNSGGSAMNWSASSTQAWIHASPSAGTLAPGASIGITVSVDPQSGAGTLVGALKIDGTGATNTPQSVGVTFTVSALPLIGLTPLTLTFDAPQGGSNPSPQFLSLTNTGGQTLVWTAGATSSPAWLGIAPPTGGNLAANQGQAITITVNTSPGGTALAEGTYTGTITITGTGTTGTPAANSPQMVQVTLNVNTDPKIGLSADSASFTVSVDSAVSAPAGISITNTGSGTLGWSTAGGASWLDVSPGGGTLAALASHSLILTANGSGLSPGVYTATLQVAGVNQTGAPPFPSASNSPQTISVTLTVIPSSRPTSAPAGQCGLSGLEGLVALVATRIWRRVTKKRGAVA
jgi:hypothetical protein